MAYTLPHRAAAVVFALLCLLLPAPATAGRLTVKLGKAQGVTFVGAIQRWDEDGNHRRVPDAKAKVDAPAVDAKAVDAGGGSWVFQKLPPGKYDLVILAKDRRRLEGYQDTSKARRYLSFSLCRFVQTGGTRHACKSH